VLEWIVRLNVVHQQILKCAGLVELQEFLKAEFSNLLGLADRCCLITGIEADNSLLYSVLPESWKIQLGLVLLPEPINIVSK